MPDHHLTCLMRNLYAGQEATVRTGHGITDLFQIGKGVRQGCILSPCLFNLYAEYIMRNAGLEEAQAGIKIAGRNIYNQRYADDTTLMAESEKRASWWKWKRGVRKLAYNSTFRKLRSWHLVLSLHGKKMGKQWKQWQTLFWRAPKITADGDCSHEIKRCFLLGRKVMTNLDSILKRRDITSPTKVHLVKAMVFLVVMYGCESWTIKTAEHWGIDAFEVWCWRRPLQVPWTARRFNQSILKESVLGIH